MRYFLLILAVVVGQSVLAADQKPLTKEESAKVIEAAIRKAANKPTGELTKEESAKVTELDLKRKNLTEVPKGLEKLTQLEYLWLPLNKLTSVKGLEELTQLKVLHLGSNPDLTKAQITEL